MDKTGGERWSLVCVFSQDRSQNRVIKTEHLKENIIVTYSFTCRSHLRTAVTKIATRKTKLFTKKHNTVQRSNGQLETEVAHEEKRNINSQEWSIAARLGKQDLARMPEATSYHNS